METGKGFLTLCKPPPPILAPIGVLANSHGARPCTMCYSGGPWAQGGW